MEGTFTDWFIETRTEYYKNGIEFNNDGKIKENYIVTLLFL
jgi:hypothetical protein